MNSTEFSEPPTHLFSDYVEMAYLAILVILGIPLNVFILLKLIKDMKYTQKDSVKLNPTNAVLTISWILAFVCALPQLIVFETYEVYPGWYQCTDVWQLHRHCDVCPNELLQPVLLSEYTENAYNITHLIIVFWGPLVLLLISYLTIATRLMRFSSVTNRSEMRGSTCAIESSSRNGLPSSSEEYQRSSYEARVDKTLQEEPNTPLLKKVNSHRSPRMSKSGKVYTNLPTM
ncbi:unnamed protein product [Cylicocyclus nassatus]|uniref:G-protein coupled receptors family 1 profile domain-containing protein n=1 Tax=Cylicocyclus nassatus TaxID=53992 RepID=A0AA36MHD3_CYLNA|nr:unnamed protein product [Cylicocyclus nassatus]